MRRCVLFLVALLVVDSTSAGEPPQPADSRLVVELFAEHPLIVTPTGLAVDPQGRVFVAESHTHFRPEDYDGPAADRILILDDTDQDGRADQSRVFHEGFTHVMDIEFHRDGWLYVATRRDIHRMFDSDGDNVADKIELIVRLDTKGDYPHNGLSGLAFGFTGQLNFGLGENLGEPYTLIGTDGRTFSGGGEGGSTYVVNSDGTGLERVSTGWWNPYGMCVDAFGRVFGTDNDPGASPPCRLIQVIPGGDYGYEYRYGRTGLHPLIGWNGEIPGTLPMIAGTGEAPCHIVAYEAAAFPREYVGDLFTPSWADHRVERYSLSQSAERGLVDAQRRTLIEGGDDFRPVGIDVAPDGTVYVSDWVSSSYTLHRQGRVWRIRPREMPATGAANGVPADAADTRRPRLRKRRRDVTVSDKYPFLTLPGEESEFYAAAGFDPRQLAPGLERLRQRLLLTAVDGMTDSDRRAVETLAVQLGGASFNHAAARAASLATTSVGLADYAPLRSDDPLLFHAAVQALARGLLPTDQAMAHGQDGVAILLAARRGPQREEFARESLDLFLTSPDPASRFLAVKWIADEQLSDYRVDIERLLDSPDLDYRLFRAAVAALERLDGKPPADSPTPELLLQKIRDPQAPLALRRLCLRLIEADPRGLQLAELEALSGDDDPGLRLEAVRTLAIVDDPRRAELLTRIAADQGQPVAVRCAAIAGLAREAGVHVEWLLSVAQSSDGEVLRAALRGLVGSELNEQHRAALGQLLGDDADRDEAVRRLLDGRRDDLPTADDLAGWQRRLAGDGDPEAGERIFLGTQVGTCSKCHAIEGRGRAVGPDLSAISRRLATLGDGGTAWLLETILQPSKQMAPQYTPWEIITTEGKTLTGLPRRKGGSQEAYLGLDGVEFTVHKPDIELHRELPKSIMPDGLLEQLTRQELRDLFAYLRQAR